MMVYLRSWLFNIAFFSYTFIACILLFALPYYGAARNGYGCQSCGFGGCYGCCALYVGLITAWRGRHFPADQPCIYAPKHQSAWETLALTLIVPYPVFILKKQLLNIPLFGWYLRWSAPSRLTVQKGEAQCRI